MDFVPTVVEVHEARPRLGKKTVCDLVADAAVEDGLVLPAKRDTFANSLLQAYKRFLSTPNKGLHGNSKLTEEEEDFLLGYLKGSARIGDDIKNFEIREIAEVLFPEKSFGDTWCAILLSTLVILLILLKVQELQGEKQGRSQVWSKQVDVVLEDFDSHP